jgi:type II secretory pathway pseudopilin PulG
MESSGTAGGTLLMNVDRQPDRSSSPFAVRGVRAFARAERGFSSLELLVIIVIICTVVAIGVPTLHARAKASVLEVNLQTLGSLVSEQVGEGYSSEYRSTGAGEPEFFLSNHLEESLSAAGEGDLKNPFINTEGGRAVVNGGSVPMDSQGAAPAVLITDAPQYQYLLFGALSEANRRLLAGTMIVAFNTDAATVDVFYVDAKSKRSAEVVSIPTR